MKKFLLLTCAGMLSAPTFAYAQDQNPAASSSHEIVVTAQRREQRLHDVPVSVSAIGADQLEALGVRRLVDIEAAVPGVNISSGALVQPTIRGITTAVANSAENNIAFYLDGVYMSNQQGLTAYQPDLDRVEVLKGPQGTLFGRNATGGAIRFFTRGPSFEPTVAISQEFGYYDGAGASEEAISSDTRLFVAGPLVDDLLAYSVSIGHQDTGEYFSDLVTGGQRGANRRDSFRGKLLFTPMSDLDIQLTAYHQSFDEAGTYSPATYRGMTSGNTFPGAIYAIEPWETAYETSAQGGEIRQDGVILDVTYTRDWGVLSGQASYSEVDLDFTNTSAGTFGGPGCTAIFHCLYARQYNDHRQWTGELNYASGDWGMFSFVGGLYYFKQISGARGTTNGSAVPSTNNTNTTEAFSVYGELTAELTDRLSLTGGLRWNRDELNGTALNTNLSREATYENVTPRLVAMYEFTPNLNAYVSYTEGFKSGLTGITNTGSIPQFQPVDPEEVTAYEVGLKWQSRSAMLTVAAYYYDFTNKHENTQVVLPAGIANFTTNVGPVEIYGIDLDMAIDLTPQLVLRGGISWVPQAEYTDYANAVSTSLVQGALGRYQPGYNNVVTPSFDASGDRVLRAPEVSASVTLSYDSGPWDASATASYIGDQQFVLRTMSQEAYTILSANAGYEFDNGVRIGVFGRNLTGEEVISQMFGASTGFIAFYRPPRELGVSLSYDF